MENKENCANSVLLSRNIEPELAIDRDNEKLVHFTSLVCKL